MTTYPREEIEAAFAEFRRRGIETHDWAGWAQLFTEDALYEEHNLGVFNGRAAIEEWIVECMAEYPTMTLWIDWYMIEGNRISFYIWNNLPDPTGTGRRFGFPNTTILEYAGNGKFSFEGDYYNPEDAGRVFVDWIRAGGTRETPQDWSLEGIEDWAPAVPEPAFPREEIEQEFENYRKRGEIAVATGDWNQWADQFTDDAHYREHHYGYFKSQKEIRDWINGVMQPFPTMEFPVSYKFIEGNRISALIPNILPAPDGDDGYYGFDVNTILHYAGNGKWSYEEDVYSPAEAGEVIGRWIAAGGVIPKGE
ncbi:MAG: nuclear transport factor 2 family protein [Actinobacteria bacterium]|nr:nuclear transport factor 2 family protein [Actinomycetes bacterium]MCX6506053.1 nuclear transport factor 2 family protein [Actinomycetota bacterium]